MWYRIYLTVTDSSGLTHTTTRDVTPNKAVITLASNVSGLQVNLDGQPDYAAFLHRGGRNIKNAPSAIDPDPQQPGVPVPVVVRRRRGVACDKHAGRRYKYTANYSPTSSTGQYQLTISSFDLTGGPLTGYYTIIQSGGSTVKTGYTPISYTGSAGTYMVTMYDYNSVTFDHWDDGSTSRTRTVELNSDRALIAYYRTPSSYPVTHMSDTTATFGSLTYAGRQVNAEYATAQSQLVGDKIDSVTLRLQKIGSPTGTAEIGVFNSDLSVKKLFGTVNVGTLPASYADYEFRLSGSELYTIQPGDRIGIKYAGGSSSSGVYVMIDRNAADPFDGTSSQRIRYESGWLYYDTSEDLYMILGQTHA